MQRQITKFCCQCHSEFSVPAKRRTQVCCSRKCGLDYQKSIWDANKSRVQCLQCERVIPRSPYAISKVKGPGSFCCTDCRWAYTQRPEVVAKRFWSFVKKTDCCWIWTGTRERKTRYGHFALSHHKPVGAHRFSWELHNGPIPTGELVLHSCDNMACVRPDHLFLGNEAKNSEDMVRKGRSSRGERNPLSKLTDEQVIEIRRRYRFRGPTQKLAAEFGINKTTLVRVARGISWKHVTGL